MTLLGTASAAVRLYVMFLRFPQCVMTVIEGPEIDPVPLGGQVLAGRHMDFMVAIRMDLPVDVVQRHCVSPTDAGIKRSRNALHGSTLRARERC